MKPNQKELNEFVLDLVEFLGKHFTACFDKTKVAGGNEGVSVRILKTASDSELEITTDRLDPRFDFGTVHWHFREQRDSKEELFARMVSDLIGVLTDRIIVVTGHRGTEFSGNMINRDKGEDISDALFRQLHLECDKVVLKKWTEKESVIAPPGN